MVKREADGSTLSFMYEDQKISVTMMDTARYNPVLVTEDLQISANNQNKHNLDLYTNSVERAQVSFDAGRTAPIPEKPLKLVVDDPTIDSNGNIVQGKQYTTGFENLPEVQQ